MAAPPPPTWNEWVWTSLGWSPPKRPPMRPCDAAHDPVVRSHFETFLMIKKKFCPSEVAGALSQTELSNMGYEKWQDLMPALLELTWDMRGLGICEILRKDKKGKFTVVLDEDVGIEDFDGPIRVRKIVDDSD